MKKVTARHNSTGNIHELEIYGTFIYNATTMMVLHSEAIDHFTIL